MRPAPVVRPPRARASAGGVRPAPPRPRLNPAPATAPVARNPAPHQPNTTVVKLPTNVARTNAAPTGTRLAVTPVRPTAARPFGAPVVYIRPTPWALRNPWLSAERGLIIGGTIQLVPVPTPTTGAAEISPQWKKANDMIESGNLNEAMPLIENQMKLNPSLDAMYSTVNVLKARDIQSEKVDELRARTLKAAEEEINKDADRPLPYVVAAKLSLEDGDDEKFH